MSDLKTIRKLIITAVFGILGIIAAIVLIRLLLRLIGANPAADFVVFWYSLSDNFVGAFNGIYPSFGAGANLLETYSVIALIFYMSLGYLVSKSITSVVDSDLIQIASNVIDSFFKIAEFFLATRFLLKLTGAGTVSQFVIFIYNISDAIYEPFKGILPAIVIQNPRITFETSTLIGLIVIVIFDLVSESIIKSLRKSDKDAANNGQQTTVVNNPQPVAPTYVQPQYAQPAQPQHITINIPQAAPQPTVDRRTINVINPHPNYPGQGQNDLNTQRAFPGDGQGNYQQPPQQINSGQVQAPRDQY